MASRAQTVAGALWLAVASWPSASPAAPDAAPPFGERSAVDGGVPAADAGVPAADAAADAPAREQDAPRVQDSTPSPAAVALAAELERAEEVRREHARFRDELQVQQMAPATEARRVQVEKLAGEAREAPAGTDAADTLLDRVMAELRLLEPEAEAALREVATPRTAARYTPFAGATGPQDLPGADVQRLEDLGRSLSEDAAAIEREAGGFALERLTELFLAEEKLDAARVLLLEKVNTDRREELFGVDRAGMDQLRRETWHIGARVRWYGLRRHSVPDEARELLRDRFVLATYAIRGAFILAALVAVLYVSWRRQRWIDTARTVLARVIRRPRMLRSLDRAHAVLSALSGELIFLVAVWGLHRALGPAAARVHEVDLAYSLALWYALYRLVLKALHRFIEWRSSTPNPVSEATSHKILRSLRTAGRYTLAVALILMLSEITVGRGYIHQGVVHVAWLGTIALGWILIRRWRGDICDAYLRRHDAGALAGAVRGTRHRWHGFFVALIAFSVLALATAGQAARRFVFSFEQSHRLLAFVFRRRLERRAGANPPDTLAEGLPQALLAQLPEEPVAEPEKELDYYPGLDRFVELVTAWKDSRHVGSFLLVGGAGSGKTSWLLAAERKAAGLPTFRIALRKRLLSADDVVSTIAGALNAPAEARSGVKALASWIRSLPQRLFILDDLEHLFLRGLDTWRAWDAFLEIVEYSGPGVFWLCALAQHPYRYLLFARGEPPVFRAVMQLPPWSEQKLTELCCARTRTGGYALSFQDLVVDEDGAPDRDDSELSTERDFMRLLWDYSQGCPRVALHYWLRSLVPAGERHLRVRLFRTPKEDDLEDLSTLERFVLASVVWHDSLTTDEAAWSLGYPKLPCEAALAKLVEQGVIDDHGGRHRVTTRWQCAATSFLVRKHLIQP